MFRPVSYASSISLRAVLFAVGFAIVAGSCSPLWAVGLNYVDANDFTNLTPTAAIDSFAARWRSPTTCGMFAPISA